MLTGIKKLIRGDKNSKPDESHSLGQTLSTILRRKKPEEIITVEFMGEAYCYDTSRDTVQPIKINWKPNQAYAMVKTAIQPKCSEINDSCFWYLFRGTPMGFTEVTLKKIVKENKAKIINTGQTGE